MLAFQFMLKDVKRMVLVYESSPGYYYKIEKDKVKRVKREEFIQYNKNIKTLKVGDKVRIIIKPYKDGKTVEGKIKKILTKKKVHTRGHKVMLEDGTVGRMLEKLK